MTRYLDYNYEQMKELAKGFRDHEMPEMSNSKASGYDWVLMSGVRYHRIFQAFRTRRTTRNTLNFYHFISVSMAIASAGTLTPLSIITSTAAEVAADEASSAFIEYTLSEILDLGIVAGTALNRFSMKRLAAESSGRYANLLTLVEALDSDTEYTRSQVMKILPNPTMF